MSPLSWNYAVTEIPNGARQYRQIATEKECAAIAAELGLAGCASLAASYAIRAMGGGRYTVEGTIDANLTQSCIVTLEPIEARLQLPMAVEFAPELPPVRPSAATADASADVEVLSLPEVEKIEHGTLDVGRVVFEILAAGLDPYPKKPEATFDWQDPKADDERVNPFAVLAKLKPKSG